MLGGNIQLFPTVEAPSRLLAGLPVGPHCYGCEEPGGRHGRICVPPCAICARLGANLVGSRAQQLNVLLDGMVAYVTLNLARGRDHFVYGKSSTGCRWR